MAYKKIGIAVLFLITLTSCSSSDTPNPGPPIINVPETFGTPPTNFFQHIVFEAGGGAEGIGCPCARIKNGLLTMNGFRSNGTYRVAIYYVFEENKGNFVQSEGLFIAYWDIRVDDSGEAVFKISGNLNRGYHVMALDLSTGKMVAGDWLVFGAEDSYRLNAPNEAQCNLQPLNLAIGQAAMVSLDPPLANNVRETYSANSRLLGKIQPGDEVIIIGGPRCEGNSVWWEIKAIRTGLIGWTSQGDKQNDWLIPLK